MSELQHFRDLAATTRTIATCRDEAAITQLVVERAAAFARADACILLLGDGTASSRVAASLGVDEAPVAELARPLDDSTPAHLRRVLQVDPSDQFLCLPLARASLRGLLVTHRRRKRGLGARPVRSDTAKSLLAALVDHAAVALEQLAQRKATDAAQEEAAAVEAQFRLLLEATPDALVIVSGDQRILLVNAQTEELFGYPRAALIGEPLEMLMPERFRDRHAGHLARYFAAPQVRRMGAGLELFARRADGTEFPVEISLSPLDTPAGLVVLSAIRDVTERRQAEARFRSLLESAPDPIVIADAEGRIVLVNHETERVFGYARGELLGGRVEMLLPERLRDVHGHHRSRYQSEPRTRSMGLGMELLARRKDGTEFPVEVSLSPTQAEDGTLIISVIRDVTERIRAEARFRGLLEAAPDAMVISNPLGEILLVNSQTEKLFGDTREALIGQRVEALMPERFRERHTEHRAAYMSAPGVREMGRDLELYGRRADGCEFPVEISLSPLEAEDGLLITSSIRDVTERKQALTALRESEERFRTSFEYSPTAMALVGLDGRFLQVNRALVAFIGYSEPELLSHTFSAISHPEDLPAELNGIQMLLEGEVPSFSVEKRYRHKQGQLIWGRASVSLVRDHEGTAQYFVREIEDITDRRRAEEELRLQSDTLQEQARLIELAHDAIIVRDLESRVVLWNRGAENTYGFTAEQARGQVTHALLRTRFPCPAEVVTATLLEEGFWEGELVHTTRAGTLISVASRQVLQRDAKGDPRAILEINRDITGQKQAEEDRSRLLESERRKSQQLTVAVREAHHRIKNNLQAVTDLLTLESMSATAEPHENVFRDSIDRIQAIALVHDLLSHHDDVETVDGRHLVEALVPRVLRSAGLARPEVEVRITAESVSLPSKKGTVLALILNELVTNAAKHAFLHRRSGLLQVHFGVEDAGLLLAVQDDGPGLPGDFNAAQHANVGMQVVNTLVQSELKGRISLSNSQGLLAAIRFPREERE